MKKVEDGKGTIYLVLHISLVLKYIVLASVCQGYCDRIATETIWVFTHMQV
jgi:hypothetical protein